MSVSSKAWLTTFGDLLTLLLCFFVISVSQVAKQHRQKNELKQVVSPNSYDGIIYLATSGKQIASKEVTESPHLILRLGRQNFRSAYSDLNDSGALALKNFLDLSEGDLELGICNIGFDFTETVFENIEAKLAPRGVRFSIGSRVCKDLMLSKDEVNSDEIFLIANAKQNHG